MDTKILVVEDDDRIRQELLDGLCAAGFKIVVATSLRQAIECSKHELELILLDLGLPDGDGLDLCRSLRQAGRTLPIIILTARDAPDQRVRGLQVGADDYVVKPFYLPELIERVRNVLRRAGRSIGPGRIANGDLWADPDTRTAGRGKNEIDLKPREFDLLLFFLRFSGRVWTRDQLLERVWGMVYDGTERTVDMHIRRLRSKIEDDAGNPQFIQTVWGAGYKMSEVS